MSKKEIQTVCSFCGTAIDMSERAKNMIFSGMTPGIFICSQCAQNCMRLTEKTLQEKQAQTPAAAETEELATLPAAHPAEIRRYLDQYVIEQDRAKEMLAVAIYNHAKFLGYKERENPEVEIDKSNILIVGPTGVGKTHLIKTIGKMLDVPVYIADASSMTAAG